MRGHMAIEQSSSLMEVYAAAVLSDAQRNNFQILALI